MPTINQLIRKPRKQVKKKSKTRALEFPRPADASTRAPFPISFHGELAGGVWPEVYASKLSYNCGLLSIL